MVAFELGRMFLTLESCDGIEPLGVTAKNGSLAALFYLDGTMGRKERRTRDIGLTAASCGVQVGIEGRTGLNGAV